MSSIKQDKSEIRKTFIAERDSLPTDVQESLSVSVYRNLVSLLDGCGSVAIYAPIKSEVRTRLIHNYLVSMGISTLYPAVRTYGRHKTMVFTHVNDPRELNHYKHGFPQPRKFHTWPRNAIDAIIVPGSAFDHHGYRIGYGGGYYDKYLSKFSGDIIGICYDFQLTDSLPKEDHDIKMNKIITEKRVLEILD